MENREQDQDRAEAYEALKKVETVPKTRARNDDGAKT